MSILLSATENLSAACEEIATVFTCLLPLLSTAESAVVDEHLHIIGQRLEALNGAILALRAETLAPHSTRYASILVDVQYLSPQEDAFHEHLCTLNRGTKYADD